MTAGDMPLAGHPVAHLQVLHTAPHIHDLTHVLVPNDHRYLDGLLRPFVPVVNMEVGSANGGLLDFNKHIVHPDLGYRHLCHPDSLFRARFN